MSFVLKQVVNVIRLDAVKLAIGVIPLLHSCSFLRFMVGSMAILLVANPESLGLSRIVASSSALSPRSSPRIRWEVSSKAAISSEVASKSTMEISSVAVSKSPSKLTIRNLLVVEFIGIGKQTQSTSLANFDINC